MSTSQPFHINWLGATGSALGAVSSAVVLSTLGAAGTLAGAAVGSLVITVGGSIYTQSLQKTKARVVSGRASGKAAPKERNALEERGVRAGSTISAAYSNETDAPFRGLPWKRIIGVTVGLFVVAMAIIVAFELTAGRPVSSFTGGGSDTNTGTTFSGLSSGSTDKEDPDAVPAEEEPADEDQTAKDEAKNDEPAEEEPAEEKPAKEKPAEEPVPEKPAEEPAPEKPAEEPAPEKPADAPPAADSGNE